MGIYRKPLFATEQGSIYTYVWNDSFGCQLQWDYLVETSGPGAPRIVILSYRSYQQKTADGSLLLVESIYGDIPISDGILTLLIEHAAKELFRRSAITGSLKRVPANFLDRVDEGATKKFDLSALRVMSQKETAAEAVSNPQSRSNDGESGKPQRRSGRAG